MVRWRPVLHAQVSNGVTTRDRRSRGPRGVAQVPSPGAGAGAVPVEEDPSGPAPRSAPSTRFHGAKCWWQIGSSRSRGIATSQRTSAGRLEGAPGPREGRAPDARPALGRPGSAAAARGRAGRRSVRAPAGATRPDPARGGAGEAAPLQGDPAPPPPSERRGDRLAHCRREAHHAGWLPGSGRRAGPRPLPQRTSSPTSARQYLRRASGPATGRREPACRHPNARPRREGSWWAVHGRQPPRHCAHYGPASQRPSVNGPGLGQGNRQSCEWRTGARGHRAQTHEGRNHSLWTSSGSCSRASLTSRIARSRSPCGPFSMPA